ncbi:SDR family oxidoreductase [Pseudoflavitalea sp. X16]|uniref:SDR family oxidoreductase n=1 Tax=Paraflavitalea devenefica TaxID=2716334 RepID=UPI001420F0D5|nr:SDR family oxidoreductase [Paraflavitalea devenefica]NII26706.1 SDR family oxidoreductase [Paraflavitalea devenefica]
MKILITGANGLLGQHLTRLLLQQGYTVIATGKGDARIRMDEWGDRYIYHPLDITDAVDVQRVMSAVQPAVVVHAAAMTQVDECELHSEQCERTNVIGTSQVLVDAEVYSQHFIYVSTDFVFDGEQGNYREEDELKPVSYYGFTKMQAEAITETSTIPWAIVRTCLVYGNTLQGTRNNIITWVKGSLEQGKAIKVVADQWRTPTYVEDLAKGIALIIEKKATGIYHISGKDLLTPYDIAIQTADLFGLDKSRIEKVDAATFTQPGRRPPKTGFVIEKARKELGYEPLSFAEGLRKMFEKA